MQKVEQGVLQLNRYLGYDLNTVEFAIKDGVPYAIDFMNPAPDAELASVGEKNHRWIVDSMTDLILKKLETGFEQPQYKWATAINNTAKKPVAKAKATAAKKSTKKTPKASAVSGKN